MRFSRPLLTLVSCIFLFVSTPGTSFANSPDPRALRSPEFQQAFNNFCLNVDIPSIQVLTNFSTTIGRLETLLESLENLSIQLNFDFDQCLSDFGISLGFDPNFSLPGIPDLTACFEIPEFELPQCSYEIPEIDIDTSCFAGAITEIQNFGANLNIDVTTQLPEFQQCLDLSANIPNITEVPEILTELLAEIDIIFTALDEFQVTFDPDFTASLSGLVEFCGVGGGLGTGTGTGAGAGSAQQTIQQLQDRVETLRTRLRSCKQGRRAARRELRQCQARLGN